MAFYCIYLIGSIYTFISVDFINTHFNLYFITTNDMLYLAVKKFWQLPIKK